MQPAGERRLVQEHLEEFRSRDRVLEYALVCDFDRYRPVREWIIGQVNAAGRTLANLFTQLETTNFHWTPVSCFTPVLNSRPGLSGWSDWELLRRAIQAVRQPHAESHGAGEPCRIE